jgi:hypothetical protein
MSYRPHRILDSYCLPRKMTPLIQLPNEILAFILRYGNLNGDLARLRLVHPLLNQLVREEKPDQYLLDACSCFAIASNTAAVYYGAYSWQDTPKDLRMCIAFRHEIRVAERLIAYNEKADQVDSKRPRASVNAFMLFSAFTRLLQHFRREDGLRQNPPGSTDQDERTLRDMQQHLHLHWALEEVEDLISAVAHCTSYVSTILSPDTVIGQSLASNFVSQPSFANGTQLRIAESVAHNGPRWVAAVLDGSVNQDKLASICQPVESSSEDRNDVRSYYFDPRTHLNRHTRMLWLERAELADQEQRRRESLGLEKMQVKNLQLNNQIWRGSSGDL